MRQTHWLYVENRELQGVLTHDRQKQGRCWIMTSIINSRMYHQHCTHCRQPQWVEVTGKGSAVSPSVPGRGVHRRNKHSEWFGQSYSAPHFTLCAWYSAVPGVDRPFGIFMITVSSSAFSTLFFPSPLLQAGNGSNHNQMSWLSSFSFLLFPKTATWLVHRAKTSDTMEVEDGRTVFCNDQAHSSQLSRHLLWLH